MVSGAWTWLVSWTLMLLCGLAVTLVLVGCEATDGPVAASSLATPSPTPTPDPAVEAPAAPADPAAQSRAMAERLGQRMQATPIDDSFDPFAGAEPLPSQRPAGAASSPAAEDPEVSWLNGQPDPAAMAEPTVPATGTTPVAAAGLPPQFVEPTPQPPARLTRAQLLEELHEQLAATDEPALARAVTAAALSLADPQHALDPAVLEPLKPLQREAIERLQQVFIQVQKNAADPDTIDRAALGLGFDRKSLETLLADAFGQAPLTISHADLCRSVAGYGVYEPMGSHHFLSGQVNRAIVYVEVDDFAAAPLDDEMYEVRLVQELILYKEDDGLAVWRHEPTQIVDASRNRRRDFYIVQMISLPARLGEGRYRLKVRVSDQHGDAVDETTLRLQVVADASLLGPDRTAP
jgi:hypothetical protein